MWMCDGDGGMKWIDDTMGTRRWVTIRFLIATIAKSTCRGSPPAFVVPQCPAACTTFLLFGVREPTVFSTACHRHLREVFSSWLIAQSLPIGAEELRRRTSFDKCIGSTCAPLPRDGFNQEYSFSGKARVRERERERLKRKMI